MAVDVRPGQPAMMGAQRKAAPWPVVGGRKFIVAGPCSVEREEQLIATATALAAGGIDMLRVGIWKPRTRPLSYEGPGDVGLEWAKNAGLAANLPVATEVADARHVEKALGQGIDAFWIGARTTVSPFAVQALADALAGVDVPVMVKNPVNPDLELWIGALERLEHAGVKKLAAVHRGFSTDGQSLYRNRPMWEIPIELRRRLPDLPLFCDPSHICGKTELLLSVAQHAVDLGQDGLMIEVHVDPGSALTDAKQQITPSELRSLLERIVWKRPVSTDSSFEKDLEMLRSSIDRLDAQLLDVLVERLNVSRQIGRLKESGKVAVYQPARWDQLLKSRTAAAQRQDLPSDFVFRLFQLIHQESIAVQTRDRSRQGPP